MRLFGDNLSARDVCPPISLGVPRGKGARARRAFTFLEMMVVLVILGTLLAVVIPNLRGRSQSAALLGGAREIVAACKVARQAAIATQREVWIKFDPQGDRWRIDLNVDPDEEDRHNHYDRDAVYDLEQPRPLPPKIHFAKVETESTKEGQTSRDVYPVVVFYPDGTATNATVALRSERDRMMTIEVTRATGRVEAYTGEPRTLAQKLRDMGANPQAFGIEETSAPGDGQDIASAADPNAARAERERREREQYYQDALSRIVEARQNQPDLRRRR